MQQGSILRGDKLRASRIWEEGLALGLWRSGMDCSLLLLKDRKDDKELWGFWAFEHQQGEPQPQAIQVRRQAPEEVVKVN